MIPIKVAVLIDPEYGCRVTISRVLASTIPALFSLVTQVVCSDELWTVKMMQISGGVERKEKKKEKIRIFLKVEPVGEFT